MAFAGNPRSDGHEYVSQMGPLYRSRRILIELHLRSHRLDRMVRKSSFLRKDASSFRVLPSHFLT